MPANEQEMNQQYKDQGIPTPIIKIDNKSDNFATVVTLEFGDQLGELLDTVSFGVQRRDFCLTCILPELLASVLLCTCMVAPARMSVPSIFCTSYHI